MQVLSWTALGVLALNWYNTFITHQLTLCEGRRVARGKKWKKCRRSAFDTVSFGLLPCLFPNVDASFTTTHNLAVMGFWPTPMPLQPGLKVSWMFIVVDCGHTGSHPNSRDHIKQHLLAYQQQNPKSKYFFTLVATSTETDLPSFYKNSEILDPICKELNIGWISVPRILEALENFKKGLIFFERGYKLLSDEACATLDPPTTPTNCIIS